MSLNRIPESNEYGPLDFKTVYEQVKSVPDDVRGIEDWRMEMINDNKINCRVKSENPGDREFVSTFNNLIGYRNNTKLEYIRLFLQARPQSKGFLLSSLQAMSREMKSVDSSELWQKEAMLFDDLFRTVDNDRSRLLTTKYLLVFAVEPETFGQIFKKDTINNNIADLRYPIAIVKDDDELKKNIFTVEKKMLRNIFERSMKKKAGNKIAANLLAQRLLAKYDDGILKDEMLAGKAIERELTEIFLENPDLWREALESDD